MSTRKLSRLKSADVFDNAHPLSPSLSVLKESCAPCFLMLSIQLAYVYCYSFSMMSKGGIFLGLVAVQSERTEPKGKEHRQGN